MLSSSPFVVHSVDKPAAPQPPVHAPHLAHARPGAPPPALFQAGYRPQPPTSQFGAAGGAASLANLRQARAAAVAAAGGHHGSAASGASGASAGVDISDANMVTAMTKRLSALERLVSVQSADIRQRDAVISQMQEKLERLEGAGVDESLVAQCEHLQRDNKRIKRQLHEMESFLQDYGLIWVGYRDEAEEESAARRGAGDEGAPLSDEIWFDWSKMELSLNDLNASLTDAAKMNIVNEDGVHRCVLCRACFMLFV